MQFKLIDRISFIVSIVTLFLAFFIVYNETEDLLGSIIAAVLTSALAWVSYVLMRWLLLALK